MLGIFIPSLIELLFLHSLLAVSSIQRAVSSPFPAKKSTPYPVISPQTGFMVHKLLIHRLHRLVIQSTAKLPTPYTNFTCISPTHKFYEIQTITDTFPRPNPLRPKTIARDLDLSLHTHRIHLCDAGTMHTYYEAFIPSRDLFGFNFTIFAVMGARVRMGADDAVGC